MFKISEVFCCSSPKLRDLNFSNTSFHTSYDKNFSIPYCKLLVIKVCAASFTCIFIPCSRSSGGDGSPPAKAQPYKSAHFHFENSRFRRTLSRNFDLYDLANVITLFRFPSLQHALSPSHALIMQDFGREETTPNQNGVSPANNLPMFPNRETGGAGGWVSFFFYPADYSVRAAGCTWSVPREWNAKANRPH